MKLLTPLPVTSESIVETKVQETNISSTSAAINNANPLLLDYGDDDDAEPEVAPQSSGEGDPFSAFQAQMKDLGAL
jgi:hypothetical protein